MEEPSDGTEWEQKPERPSPPTLTLTRFRQFTIEGKSLNYGGTTDIYKIRDRDGNLSVLKLYRSSITPHIHILEKISQFSRRSSRELIEIREFGHDEETSRSYEDSRMHPMAR